jgi:predicted RNase H-like HicB family nuclease
MVAACARFSVPLLEVTMKKKDFENLTASIREAGRIRRGEANASRVTEFDPVDAIGINQELPMPTRYTVSDGKLVLTLETAEEGGYIITSPLDPELITQAETLEEAFANARDATQALKQSRIKLLRRLLPSSTQK